MNRLGFTFLTIINIVISPSLADTSADQQRVNNLFAFSFNYSKSESKKVTHILVIKSNMNAELRNVELRKTTMWKMERKSFDGFLGEIKSILPEIPPGDNEHGYNLSGPQAASLQISAFGIDIHNKMISEKPYGKKIHTAVIRLLERKEQGQTVCHANLCLSLGAGGAGIDTNINLDDSGMEFGTEQEAVFKWECSKAWHFYSVLWDELNLPGIPSS